MKRLVIIFFLFGLVHFVDAQNKPRLNGVAGQAYSQQMTQTAMNIWPDSFIMKAGPARWSYDQGVILKGVEGVWKLYGEGKYFNYIQHSMDFYVRDNGTIKDYNNKEFNIDHTNNGKVVLTSEFGTAISKNPYLAFKFKGGTAGDKVALTWKDNKGETRTDEAAIA